jgi:antitoxin component YwqK of YwqJK toxin-antitoxin module
MEIEKNIEKEKDWLETNFKYISKYLSENIKSELCFIAVKQHGILLEYVPDEVMSEELCLEAVKQDGKAIKYVPEKLITKELCFEAVKINSWAIDYVPKDLQDEIRTMYEKHFCQLTYGIYMDTQKNEKPHVYFPCQE